jgi:anti-anti-sigma factor
MSARQHQLPGESARDASFGMTLSAQTGCGEARMTGEIDFTCTDRFYALLDQVRRDDRRHLVLELSQLRFLSAGGAGVLARAAEDYAQTRPHPSPAAIPASLPA